MQRGEVPKLQLPPKTISGPAAEQTAKAQAGGLKRPAMGWTIEGSAIR